MGSERRKFGVAGGYKERWGNITIFMLDVVYKSSLSIVSHMKYSEYWILLTRLRRP